eukprot:TRINITY_DN5237_c0_g1_i2.p1 TRINITY_DN5237_c0_g1~~TRINITY_DN5237_c0_g1_i2.p1  ORF type:complete len:183 (-),score=33.15 TRINITY_DN5237_c0_g1_i2:48-596(-)
MSVSPLQRKKLIDLFSVIDTNHSSQIDWSDYEELLKTYKKVFSISDSDPRLSRLLNAFKISWATLNQVDTNKDGKISPVEFVKSYSARILAKDDKFTNDIAAVFFATFDQDGSGSISEEEYTKAVSIYAISPEQAKIAYSHLDVNHDGTISHTELNQLVKEYFFSSDPIAAGNWLFAKDYSA